MSRAFHEACSTALRTAMADLIGKPHGGWALLGCITTSEGRTGWAHLPGLTRALQAAFDARAAITEVSYGSIFDAAADLARALPPDGAPGGGALRGIALVCNIDDADHGRVCIADAVFDDAWIHTVTWNAKAAAPTWEVLAPPEQTAPESRQHQALSALLAAVLVQAGQGARLVGDDQVALSVCLADRLDACMAAGLHMVFVIVRTSSGWEALPATDLAKRVGAKVRAGAGPLAALRSVIAEITANPPVPVIDLAGIGTVIHHDPDDGSVATVAVDDRPITAHLVALTDAALHSGAWIHGEARPDWQIHPRTVLDTEFAPVDATYAALLEALRGTRH
ncbi:hypothetical protein K3N28_05825 [Glycomyces sp. TRM65418]|uniref:hypothetical protein n=1 Tax=Glycomyces sp. TRM65418 TaxID=2867006 RepID=UPI001CE50B6E|nr:hypothetical protein [Glycomyces sp. TRM65418]MCC3762587.1 hypothetical protein [Glycomyces sp. TRM65418]QZD56626.1 hypothetical protein K3N28_05785 [Glycomyces sp. TRM65418]